MKSNLLTAITLPQTVDKQGLFTQNVNVFIDNEIQRFPIPSEFIPFSKYGKVTDRYGETHILTKKVNDKYFSSNGEISGAISNNLPLNEGTILIGFIRERDSRILFDRFIPVIGLIHSGDSYLVYDFKMRTTDEVFQHNLLESGFADYYKYKELAIRYHTYSFDKVYRNREFIKKLFKNKKLDESEIEELSNKWFSMEELKEFGVTEINKWDIKLL